MNKPSSRSSLMSLTLAALLLAGLGACSSTPDKPKPAELGPNNALLGVRQAWQSQIGEVAFPLQVRVLDGRIAVAGSDGQVAMLEADTGRDLWRAQLKEPLSAGVGSDGSLSAVVTRNNQLVTLSAQGQEVWRQTLSAQVQTAPLVAGGRVFVLAADRSVSAFDGQTGRKLWTQQRAGEALVLQQAGLLLAVEDTLVLGWSGRMVGLNPANGTLRWEVPVAVARGSNDVERLVDLVGPGSRDAQVVCARAFQSRVACVDAVRGSLLWSQSANGYTGLGGHQEVVFGTETDGRLQAWKRSSGAPVWTVDKLRYRGLSAPLSAGRAVVVGDSSGLLHLLSADDGSALNRLSTDGSPIEVTPVLAGQTLVAVTRQGRVYGFKPE